tara:strand:- start:108227 stop:109030 length:804 start_codon:yes stop_codon:yes gene_type:complete
VSDQKFPQANKSLGQHFLIDQNVIELITTNFTEVAKNVLEVGPGPGVLTKHLASKDLPIFLVEKDARFPALLKEYVNEDDIFLHDALKFDFEEKFKEKNWKDVWLVSNLPYNVSSPLLVQFLQLPSIKYMTLMFQREVADKAFPIDTRVGKAMNSLLALTQNYFEVSLLCKVPQGAFQPPPKVESAVLSFVRRDEPLIPLAEFKAYERFLRHLFRFKRKQVGKILKSYQTDIDKVNEALSAVGRDRTDRAESFKLEEIQKLYIGLKD